MSTKRNRRKHAVSFDARLQMAADQAHEAARQLPEGEAREALLERARQAETAAHINGWLTSPGQRAQR